MGIKIEWPTITVLTALFVVADRSYRGYDSMTELCKCKSSHLPLGIFADIESNTKCKHMEKKTRKNCTASNFL